MNDEEIKSLIEQLKAQGLSEDEIMQTFYDTFTEGKMDREDLEVLAEAMGYELTDDFKNDPNPDPISEEGLSKEDLEDAKEIEPGESKEEFQENIEEAKEGLGELGEEAEEPELEEGEEKEEAELEEDDEGEEEKSESEDEEWEKAQKLFKI